MSPLILLVLLPAVAALAGLFSPRRALARAVAWLFAAANLGVGAWVFLTPGPRTATLMPALPAGGVRVPLELTSSPALAAVAAIVTLVALAVQVYAAWYLENDDRYPRFAATVSLFTAAMLLVVTSGDLVLTLLGWEVMGWCSYLLIGHWSREDVPRRAAHKAFMVTRVADIGFVVAVFGLAAGAGSTRISEVIAAWEPTPDTGLRALLLTLLVVGVLGKSAQFPFQDWLPDAMAGPTPASALIHAATMVAAGTVVLASVFDLLSLSGAPRWVLGLSTAITMVLSALFALGQSDLKRLLAWSTVSQVAIMLSALAVAPKDLGPQTGLFHMWSHASFKAVLFLVIGAFGVVAGGTSALALRGSARRWPAFHAFLVAGLVSLAGVPFVLGGMSKEGVFEAAYLGAEHDGPGLIVLTALLLTAVLTAMYSVRAYLVMVSRQAAPAVAPGHGHDPTSTPGPAVLVMLGALAALSVFGGLVTLGSWFTQLPHFSWLWVAVAVVVVGVGASAALLLAKGGDAAERLPRWYRDAADRGLGFDGLYHAAIATPVLGLARAIEAVDRRVLDGAVAGVARLTVGLGEAATRWHRSERPATGAALVVTGMLLATVIGVLSWV